ncbi:MULTISPECIES: hypothetical protein [unclassified Treponema]|uniref:hypothetical protein n=1 Tax=unclassified Treponema TaxID=2638727 RepID=UPI0020A3A901|nr:MULTISPECIES: hypothetical protein [unclassified Treponema]UTC66084.1 hypothetical protein E4O06_08620 [Treponema sp. OMZ 789]UTC68814.1 hypothetical protein E4O01_08760 [Treponema sp. OMZ 790]UTC71542.1 hypothetical protein E4O02_08950 [Treponema sp. OMZ 791]
MNKKIFFVCLAFALIFTGMLTAKSIGLNLEVGAAYTNHQLHRIGRNYAHDGFRHHGIRSKSLGGVNIGISYPLPKNWEVFANTTFAFNNTFVNDTMLGVGYVFKPGKGFNLLLGGAFAFGGSVFSWPEGSTTVTTSYFNIGGGINFTASYMFTRKFGMYAGASAIYYKPVAGNWSRKVGNSTNSGNIQSNTLPDLAKSINIKLGLKVRL